MAQTEQLVEVMPFSGLRKALAYRVPAALENRLQVGHLVRVPLGKKSVCGIVTQLESTEPIDASKLKQLYEILVPDPLMDASLLRLAHWMEAYYAASHESVLEAMVPAVVRRGIALKVTRYLKVGFPINDTDFAALQKRAPRQAELYTFLKQQAQPLPKATVLSRLKMTAQVAKALIDKGLVFELTDTQQRDAYMDAFSDAESVTAELPELTDEQAVAVGCISKQIQQGGYATHLLHGVTGSGKTEVYLRLIQQVLEAGGSAMFLVPEVALTPQTVARVRSRLKDIGTRVVVWHSHLSDGERYDGWLALASGDARVVVGARSAVFAPLKNLRLVVVDEEHEPSYKQSETPRYHGRDVAVYRARLHGAVCVLGSATPALESLYNVSTGQYKGVRLLKRVDDRQLPRVIIVDMKREKPGKSGLPLLSQCLADKLMERFEKKEQSILFLNRRGWSRSLLCPDCDHVPMCPHCAVPLTYHRAEERLKCHLCGYFEPAPKKCPKCGSTGIRLRGFGTQRIEDQVARLLPQATVVRLDADTMTKKHLFRRILSDFRSGKIDILVGTQMIAKGLDFPNVTLVGMVDADLSLHVPDFRAGERAFQLLVQVSGRAGRGDRAGEVVVQTHLPFSAPIQFARQGDFDGFLEAELEERKQFNYPPFRHLVRHIFRGRNPEKVAFFAEQWVKSLEKSLETPVEIRGPAPCHLEKLKDNYRFHIFYFTKSVTRLVPELIRLRDTFPLDTEVVEVLDVDAIDLV